MDRRVKEAVTKPAKPKLAFSDAVEQASKQPRSFWKEFSHQTTLHGIKYAVGDDSGKVRRCLWVIVLLASLAFLLYMITITAMQYSQHQSMLTISEMTYSQLTLPAITVCNNNLYKASLVRQLYPHVEGSFRRWAGMVFGEETLDIDEFFAEMNDTALNDTWVGMERTMHARSDVYIRCKIGSVLLNCADYTTKTVTDKGACFTFNGLRMDGSDAKQLSVNKQGHMTAIQLTLDVQPDDYFIPLTYATGLLIGIHDQYEMAPFLEDRNIVIPPGRDVYISLLKTVLTRLDQPYSKQACVESKYHLRGQCHNNCKTQHVFECGQCNAGSRPVDDDPDLCTFQQAFQCSMTNIPKWYDGGFQCLCPLSCEETQFEYKLSYGAFPNTLALEDARRLNWTYQQPDDIAANYANVNIYYEDLKTIYRAQTPLVTQWQLFSSVGGLMGLALGTSFITLLEFLDFAGVYLYKKVQQRKRVSSKVSDVTGEDDDGRL